MAPAWLGILDVVVGCVISAVFGVAAWLFKQLRAELAQNSRHVQSVMFNIWNLIWRTDALEDFAKEHHGYVPPRALQDWPFRDGQ